jgi:hypothetical protein
VTTTTLVVLAFPPGAETTDNCSLGLCHLPLPQKYLSKHLIHLTRAVLQYLLKLNILQVCIHYVAIHYIAGAG